MTSEKWEPDDEPYPAADALRSVPPTTRQFQPTSGPYATLPRIWPGRYTAARRWNGGPLAILGESQKWVRSSESIHFPHFYILQGLACVLANKSLGTP
jgi:hypothetical protein